jgi:hypothetical protein
MRIDLKTELLLRKQYKTSTSFLWLGGAFLVVCLWTFFPLSAQRLDADMFKNVLAAVGLLVCFFSFVIRPLLYTLSLRNALVEVEETNSRLIGSTVRGAKIILTSKSPELQVRPFYSIEYQCFLYLSEAGAKYYYPIERIVK